MPSSILGFFKKVLWGTFSYTESKKESQDPKTRSSLILDRFLMDFRHYLDTPWPKHETHNPQHTTYNPQHTTHAAWTRQAWLMSPMPTSTFLKADGDTRSVNMWRLLLFSHSFPAIFQLFPYSFLILLLFHSMKLIQAHCNPSRFNKCIKTFWLRIHVGG